MRELCEEEVIESIFKSKGTVVVDFFAPWCKPCKALEPQLEKLSQQVPEAQFLKVNTEKLMPFSESQGVMSLPTIIVYKDGKQAGTVTGCGANTIAQVKGYM